MLILFFKEITPKTNIAAFVMGLRYVYALGCQTTNFWSSFFVADAISTELLAKKNTTPAV